MPAHAALTDSLANPDTAMVGHCALLFDPATQTWLRARVANVFKDLATPTITTIQTAWTPATGKKVRLMGGEISVSAVMSVLFEDNAGGGGVVYRTPKLEADKPYVFKLGNNGRVLAAANNLLKITGSAAGTVTGTIYGCEDT